MSKIDADLLAAFAPQRGPLDSSSWTEDLAANRAFMKGRRALRRLLLTFALVVLPLLQFGNAAAIPITITDKTPSLVATAATCAGGGMKFKNCTSTAFLNNASIDGTNPDFLNQFNAWNATNPKDSMWTLANGGALPGGTIDVSVFRAKANNINGGLDMTMSWAFNGSKTGFFWIQGLNLNYTLQPPAIGAAFDELDLNKNIAMPPLYPFQGGLFRNLKDSVFVDTPRGLWPDSFFTASAFLGTVDFTKRTLTINEGVRYGFKLDATKAPEPASILLLASALLGFAVLLRWRAPP